MSLSVFSPVSGIVTALADVPDPVFAEKMLGDGLAINPSDNTVYAPVSGTVTTLHKSLHAVAIENNGVEVLIHIGVETVSMKGEGFCAFTDAGRQVKQGDKLITFDRDLIARKAASNLVIVIISNLPEVELHKTEAGAKLEAGDFLFSLCAEGKPEESLCREVSAGADDGFIVSDTIIVRNKNGFHARPAALIASLAASFRNTEIKIIKGAHKANAKSMVEIMGLSIDQNDAIQIAAAGVDRETALESVVGVVLKGLNKGANNPPDTQHGQKHDFTEEKEVVIYGVPVFPELVTGKSFAMKKQVMDVEENAPDCAVELARLKSAIENVKTELNQEINASTRQRNNKEILQAHITIMDDPFLLETAQSIIRQGRSAGFAWCGAIGKGIEMLNATGNKFIRERTDDYRDAEARVLSELTGKKHDAPDFPQDSIVVVNELLAHELGLFNDNVIGVVAALGSSTSHVAIMLRNMGLASVLGAGDGVLDIPDGSDVVLNSEPGVITVNHSNIDEIKKQKAARDASRAVNLRCAHEPAATKDGVFITVKGNVCTVEEAQKAARNGSEGIGLVRTEFLFTGDEAPGEEEQRRTYQTIADTQKGRPVIIRTFDAGSDKPLRYMDIADEENPMMGLRGVRNYKNNMELFRTQVRAVMRVAPAGTARIMLPMVSFIDELVTYRRIIMDEREKLGIEKVSLGIMVEVPSVAILAAEFAAYVDFFSIGTNDLTQYVLAIDRGHPVISPLLDSLNPAVLKLIQMTCEGAAGYGKPVGVCGAIASDLAAVPTLLGLGIRDLSVVSGLIPDVKAFIRTLNMYDCREAAAAALKTREAPAPIMGAQEPRHI